LYKKLLEYSWGLSKKTCVRSVVMIRFYRVLTMVYSTQNYWVFGLFPLSGVLISFCPEVKGGEDIYSAGALRKVK
jgi:hypothetical protein